MGIGFRVAFIFSLTIFTSFGHAEEIRWQLFKSQVIDLPYGNSASPLYQYSPPLNQTWVRVNYVGAGCDALAYRLNIRTTAEAPLVAVFPSDGIFKTPGPTLFEYKVFVTQTRVSRMTCTENFYVAKAPQTQTADFSLIGTALFTGGSSSLVIPIPSAREIHQIRVVIPEFCAGIELRGVDVVVNSVPRPLRVLDRVNLIYEVEGTFSANVSHVQLLLAGPTGGTCQLGVYSK